MIIEKKYKFYAAHRNELLVGTKCCRLHGHRYGLDVGFKVARDASSPGDGAVTTLFEDLDRGVDLLVARLDHRTFCNAKDSDLVSALQVLGDAGASDHVYLPYPSSVENVAHFIFGCLRLIFPPHPNLQVSHIRLQETDTSTILYGRGDWDIDWAAGKPFVVSIQLPVLGLHATRVKVD